jgi:hypothetical protein
MSRLLTLCSQISDSLWCQTVREWHTLQSFILFVFFLGGYFLCLCNYFSCWSLGVFACWWTVFNLFLLSGGMAYVWVFGDSKNTNIRL